MVFLRLSILLIVVTTSFLAGCSKSSDSNPSQLTAQATANGSFLPERTVTREEMDEILSFESQQGSSHLGKPAVGWRSKTLRSNTDSTNRTVTVVTDTELIEFRDDRAIYKTTTSEVDSAGYSLTNEVWVGAYSTYIDGKSEPSLEISKTPGQVTGDPNIKGTPSPGAMNCKPLGRKRSTPAIIELGKYRFAEDGNVLPIAFRIQEKFVYRFLCGENQQSEFRGTGESISIVAPDGLSVFSSGKGKLDNGIPLSSYLSETLRYQDSRKK